MKSPWSMLVILTALSACSSSPTTDVDLSVIDSTTTDLVTKDQAPPDQGPPDMAAPDQAAPDQSLPDQLIPDQSHPDGPPPLQDCSAQLKCTGTKTCMGIPKDGSGTLGKCVDTKTKIPGDGVACGASKPCLPQLICVGEFTPNQGTCSPAWMGATYPQSTSTAIPDADPKGITDFIVAYGLATVPVDIELTLDIVHPRQGDLYITLTDPNGVKAVIWNQTGANTANLKQTFPVASNPRDDNVNGKWTLFVQDKVTGNTGTLKSWSLYLSSRWD